ncbi:MAG: flagellar hook-length control protein FliK [Saccharospirillum sp.]|uniref:flagellar hook-length control protein FliK n=1 Tax=Saccharospirillum sp. TaxID=2033801 RepID=UPI003297CE6B
MQLLSPQFAVSSTREAVVADTDAKAPALSQRGFQSVFSEYTHRSESSASVAARLSSARSTETPASGLSGQLLPQRQTDTGPIGESELALDNLADTLEGLTTTLENLLALEQDVPEGETGPLTDMLVGHLGLTEEAAEDFINTLQTWVADPPTVAMTAEALDDLGPEALLAVQAMGDSLASLGADVNQWYQQVAQLAGDASTGFVRGELAVSSQEADTPELMNTGLPLTGSTSIGGAPRERTMLETLQQWSQALNDGQGGLSQLVTSIAERVRAVLNTAAGGSLPSTFDQSRPESALLAQDSTLLADKPAPAADTLFSKLLQAGGPVTDHSDSLAAARLSPLAAAVADDARQPLLAGQPIPEKADAVNAVIQRSLQQPVLAGEAGRQLGERLALMVRGDIQQATIRLDPPELGMMDVRITVQNDQTQVQIVVQSPQVREALESQSVRLREFLEQQGLSLAKLDIREESAGHQQAGSEQGNDNSGNTNGLAAGDDESSAESATSVAWGQGLVDHFV